MMVQYCRWSSSVCPDMTKLREVLTLLSDEQKLRILQQKRYSVCGTQYSGWTVLECAARRDHTEIISTLLTSLQSSTDRLKLLMAYENITPLHEAARRGLTESVKMILDCLTADQQIQLISVRTYSESKTAVQYAKIEQHTDTVRVLKDYQQRAERLQKQQEQSRLHKSVSGRLS